ncbi:hypothetical protein GUJ93_ZPchr0013g37235 [Zizania palustris]|uniref:Uncharacterized protein n=1 Tax=Zizania palustris TaxID=103762 RepID=A0A8J6BUA7_ZIZPA|nr:hypothetical protein GUJ93_ZPchr0013g37235 [Zizania palustris]
MSFLCPDQRASCPIDVVLHPMPRVPCPAPDALPYPTLHARRCPASYAPRPTSMLIRAPYRTSSRVLHPTPPLDAVPRLTSRIPYLTLDAIPCPGDRPL